MLAEFVGTRSAYIAQTALYGYLKTRMGTQFTRYFEDGMFSAAIRDAVEKQLLSCLADLAVFSAATASQGARMGPDRTSALALHCFREGHCHALPDGGEGTMPNAVLERFEMRIRRTDWAREAEGRNAFVRSEADLIQNAPVIDQFKREDGEIVTNSIRFKWRDVREQLRTRIDRDAICREWQGSGDGRTG